MTHLFTGASDHGLDDKGRLTLPSRILESIAQKDWRFFLTVSMDKCLLLHDAHSWQALVDRIGTGVHGSPAHRNLARRFLGSAEEVAVARTPELAVVDDEWIPVPERRPGPPPGAPRAMPGSTPTGARTAPRTSRTRRA